MTAQRHPVAELLNDEQRARVRAAEFEKNINGIRRVGARLCCPLAVALDLPDSSRRPILAILGERPEVIDFMRWADCRNSDPADVYVMLGADGES